MPLHLLSTKGFTFVLCKLSKEFPIFIDIDSCPSCPKRENIKYLEKREECFILEFDPNNVADSSDNFTRSIKKNLNEVFPSDDVTIVSEKGQVACRDYPHPRHFCVKYPFEKTKHVNYCKLCYCYVCDVSAPFEKWTLHCHAFDNKDWRLRRANRRRMVRTSGNFLNIQPTELKFTFEVNKHSSCSLQLRNKTDQFVAFRVIKNKYQKYSVCFETGVVLPGSTRSVTVTMEAQEKAPLDMQSKDTFLIQSVVAPNGTMRKEVLQQMLSKQEGKVVDELQLKVVYVPSNQACSVVLEGSEGYLPRSCVDAHNLLLAMFGAAYRNRNDHKLSVSSINNGRLF